MKGVLLFLAYIPSDAWCCLIQLYMKPQDTQCVVEK